MDRPVGSIWNKFLIMTGPRERIDKKQPVKTRNVIGTGMFRYRALAIKQYSPGRFLM